MSRFTAWTQKRAVEDFYLPRIIQETTGQSKVPIGDAVLALQDTVIGYEICEVLDTYYWNSGGMFIFHDFIKSCEAFKNSQDNKHVSSLIKSGKQLNLTLTLCWLQPSLLLRGCPSQSNSLESSSLAEAVASCP